MESLLALRHREPSAKRDSNPRGSGSSRRANESEKWEDLSRVGNSFRHPMVGYARAIMLRIEEMKLRKMGVPPGLMGGEENKEEEEEEEEEEEDPEEDVPDDEIHAIPRPMDMDAIEDYLQYLEELRHRPEYSAIHSSQAFAQSLSDDDLSQSSDAHSQPSYDLSGVWPPSVGPSQ
ncbi:hypothetical protein PIB30_044918 [Stylosanthes scabra]|uniref:Uncharacterized protein n=1 Tax=Stylosanthes scabra TaxID=79078 RepID=A0ABU6XHM0_9FABA|nr:hypothetical protein [Stylosanthes scabra]